MHNSYILNPLSICTFFLSLVHADSVFCCSIYLYCFSCIESGGSSILERAWYSTTFAIGGTAPRRNVNVMDANVYKGYIEANVC